MNQHHENEKFAVINAKEITRIQDESGVTSISKHENTYYLTTQPSDKEYATLLFSTQSFQRAIIEFRMTVASYLDTLESDAINGDTE
jgi:hypothetical protein